MKDLIKIIKKDYECEGFTVKDWLIFGVLFPIAIYGAIYLVNCIDKM